MSQNGQAQISILPVWYIYIYIYIYIYNSPTLCLFDDLPHFGFNA